MSHKHKIIALVGAGVLSAVAAMYWIQFEGSTAALIAKFPDVPEDIVRKVSKEMVREALAGKYNDIDTDDDELMSRIFVLKAVRLMEE